MVEVEKIKQQDEMFCPSCGRLIKKEAVICVNCGVAINQLQSPKKRDKVVAVLLAIFCSFFAWIYTWDKDQWKFWVALGVTIVTLGFGAIVFEIWAIVDAARRSDNFYTYYPTINE